MSWANLDDRLHAHPKVRRLQRIPFAGAEAFGIWAWCLSWCRAYSPDDGRVELEAVALDWSADPEHMAHVFDLLAEVRLVDKVDGGYIIHDWADWQLDGRAHQVLAGKARAASGVRGTDGRYVHPAGPPSAMSAKLGQAGVQPGHASPLHTTPLPRAREGVKDPNPERVATIMAPALAALSAPRAVPKPVRTKRP